MTFLNKVGEASIITRTCSFLPPVFWHTHSCVTTWSLVSSVAKQLGLAKHWARHQYHHRHCQLQQFQLLGSSGFRTALHRAWVVCSRYEDSESKRLHPKDTQQDWWKYKKWKRKIQISPTRHSFRCPTASTGCGSTKERTWRWTKNRFLLCEKLIVTPGTQRPAILFNYTLAHFHPIDLRQSQD